MYVGLTNVVNTISKVNFYLLKKIINVNMITF